MKAKIRILISLFSGIITLLALSGVSSACASSLYQPKVPKCLTEKK